MTNRPTEAYLVTYDGEVVNCLIEKVNKRSWQGVPVRDVYADEVVNFYIDLLPGKSSFVFLLKEEDEED